MPTVIILLSACGKGVLIVYSHSVTISEPGMELKEFPTFKIASDTAPYNDSLDAVFLYLD